SSLAREGYCSAERTPRTGRAGAGAGGRSARDCVDLFAGEGGLFVGGVEMRRDVKMGYRHPILDQPLPSVWPSVASQMVAPDWRREAPASWPCRQQSSQTPWSDHTSQ